MKVAYTRRSIADFDDIFERGLRFGKPIAKQVERHIRAECALLAKFPQIGTTTDLEDVRRVPIVRYPFTVYYRIDRPAGRIEILRIVRSSSIRDLGQVPN